MTKSELLREYKELLEAHNMDGLDGVNANSRKDEIQNAIDCLKCDDEILDEYMIIVKHKYSGIYKAVIASDFKRHSHNRLYIYDTARRILDIA